MGCPSKENGIDQSHLHFRINVTRANRIDLNIPLGELYRQRSSQMAYSRFCCTVLVPIGQHASYNYSYSERWEIQLIRTGVEEPYVHYHVISHNL